MSYVNNKGADQPAHLRSLISAFVVRCLDSIISLDSIAKISTLANICGWAGQFVSGLVRNSRRQVLLCRGSDVLFSSVQVKGFRLPILMSVTNRFCLLLSDYHLFQYFMKIVPTEVNTYANNLNTYQFSVTERVGVILPSKRRCFTHLEKTFFYPLRVGVSHYVL